MKTLNDNEISFFDVKQLYDAAHELKAKAWTDLGEYIAMLAEADRMAAAYIDQLTATPAFSYARAVA